MQQDGKRLISGEKILTEMFAGGEKIKPRSLHLVEEQAEILFPYLCSGRQFVS
jgi:hypothetical protein